MSVHLSISHLATGEIRLDYLGPDRLAAQNAYAAAPAAGVVLKEYYPYLQVEQRKKFAVQVEPELDEPLKKRK
jgi:hypothetical protein